MDFAFLKQRYDYELERKDKLTNAVSQSAGFLTLVSGLLAVMARGFSYEQVWLTVVFTATVILAVGAAAFSVGYLAVVYAPRKYRHLPHLGELVRKQRDVFKLRLLHGTSEAEEAEAFKALLRREVIELSDRNAAINMIRSLALNRANHALILMLTFTAISGVSYVVDQTVRSFMPRNRIVLTDPPDFPPPELKPLEPVEVPLLGWPSRWPPGFRLELPWWARLLDWSYRLIFGGPPPPPNRDDEKA